MKDKTSNSSDVKEKSKKGRYSLKKLLDRSRFSPSLLFLSKSFASKSTEAPNEEQRKSVHDDMMEINANIRNSASSSPHSYSPDYRRRLTASVPFDCSDSPIITTTEFRNPACGSDQASPNSEVSFIKRITAYANLIYFLIGSDAVTLCSLSYLIKPYCFSMLLFFPPYIFGDYRSFEYLFCFLLSLFV
ncbi:unnamed protein product [Trichobilharzia regenti]|nr:unnamed protein product [Trichobilharzia regenti]